MADHVAVGVVDHDHIKALLLDGFDDAVGHFRGVHFWLQVVGSDLRRRDQDALFAFERFFAATGEEERDVCILLCLGDAQLGLAVLRQVFAQNVVQAGRGKRGGCRDFRRILGQADVRRQLGQACAWEFVEVWLDECARQLAGAVGAEVHEDDRVAILDLDGFANARGLDELVVLLAGVGRLQAGKGAVGGVFGGAVDDQVVGGADAVPAVVAVHGVVAADQAGDAALAELGEGGVEQFDGGLGAAWRGVAAVEEGVQVDLLGAALRGQLGHGDQVVLVAVHATVGEQAEDMHGLAGTGRLVHCASEHGVLEELAVTDGLGHPGEVLVNHAAGAEVHVTDFGVAHLPVGQAHVHAGTGDQTVRLGGAQAVVDRCVGGEDGVVFGAFAVTEAIQDDQDQGFRRTRHQSNSRLFKDDKDTHFRANPPAAANIPPLARPARSDMQHEGAFPAGPVGFGGHGGLCILAAIFNRLEHR